MSEGRFLLLEREEVTLFIVGGAIEPAPPEDSDPLEGEASKDGLVAFARLLLLSVIRLCPGTLWDGLAGPFDKGLTEEL